MQNRGMRQSLHRRYQDESRKVEIGDVDLATMSLEITSKERASAPQYGVDIFEPPGAGNFFVQDAVKLRIDAVSIDPGRNQLAYSDLDRARGDLIDAGGIDELITRHGEASVVVDLAPENEPTAADSNA